MRLHCTVPHPASFRFDCTFHLPPRCSNHAARQIIQPIRLCTRNTILSVSTVLWRSHLTNSLLLTISRTVLEQEPEAVPPWAARKQESSLSSGRYKGKSAKSEKSRKSRHEGAAGTHTFPTAPSGCAHNTIHLNDPRLHRCHRHVFPHSCHDTA